MREPPPGVLLEENQMRKRSASHCRAFRHCKLERGGDESERRVASWVNEGGDRLWVGGYLDFKGELDRGNVWVDG